MIIYPAFAGLNAPGLEAEASALIAAMAVKPDAARTQLINSTIHALKVSGVWAKLDALWVLGAHTKQAAFLNWLNPATHTITESGTATFTTDLGWTSDGATGHGDLHWNPAVDGVNFTRDSAMMSVYCGTASALSGSLVGWFDATSSVTINPHAASDEFSYRLNSVTGFNTPANSNVNSVGHYIAERTAAGVTNQYHDSGAPFASPGAIASTGLLSHTLLIGGTTASAFISGVVGLVAFGAPLTGTGERQAFVDAIATYVANLSPPAIDTVPDAFTFTDITGAAFSTIFTSNTVTIGGLTGSAAISVSGGTYSIDGGAFTAASGTILNGQTVAVRQTSSSSASTQTDVVLTIGGVSDAYSVTTRAYTAADTISYNFVTDSYDHAGSNYANIAALLSGGTRATFAQSIGGLYTDSTGAYSSFAADTVRRGDVGWLCEPSSTNILVNSNTFSIVNTTITTGQAGDPLGGSTRVLVAEDTTTNAHAVNGSNGTIATGTTYTLSYHGKSGTRAVSQLRGGASSYSGLGYANVSMTAGSPSVTQHGGTISGFGVKTLANGWCRPYGSLPATTSATRVDVISPSMITSTTDSRSFNYTGVATNNLSLWGAQVEPGSVVTSYIATSGAAVTRPKDDLAIILPTGNHTLTITYSDNSTVALTGQSGTVHIAPDANRFLIKTIVGARTS